MAQLSEKFKEIFFLAREGMGIQDEGLDSGMMAGNLLMMNSIAEDLGTKAKDLKKMIKEASDSTAEDLVRTRNNPNSKLSDYEELPKSTSLGDVSEPAQAEDRKLHDIEPEGTESPEPDSSEEEDDSGLQDLDLTPLDTDPGQDLGI